jgi:DNA-binding transcriptional LysR family regulator
VQATYDNISTIWTHVAQGFGWCLASRATVSRPPAGTVAIKLNGLDIPWGLDLAWRRDERGAAVHAVIEAFRAARAANGTPNGAAKDVPAERTPRVRKRAGRPGRSRRA